MFEGLLTPPHNNLILDALYVLATWHAFAKLRLHTETTLTHFDRTTTALGVVLRRFVQLTCAAFKTKELPQEEAARGRRKAALAANKATNGVTSTSSSRAEKPQPSSNKGAKDKLFNMGTYKLHALGDYVSYIRQFGTSDSYTTQVVCTFPSSD